MFFYSEYGKMFLECKYMSLFKEKRKVEEINISLEETDNAIEEKVEVKEKTISDEENIKRLMELILEDVNETEREIIIKQFETLKDNYRDYLINKHKELEDK